MRQTVTNMLGTLPSQFFAITVSTVSLSGFCVFLPFQSLILQILCRDYHDPVPFYVFYSLTLFIAGCRKSSTAYV
jgi:hypothetical protein